MKSVFLIGVLTAFAGGGVARAAPCPGPNGTIVNCPLQYHGGPILDTFTIYPLFFGVWKQSDMDLWYAYLESLAAYMSGENAPSLEQPVMKQYGVNHVAVGARKRASPDAAPGPLKGAPYPLGNVITRDFLAALIAANQSGATPTLPPFGPHTLIMVLPGDGFTVHGGACGTGGGCHPSESTSAFWAVVPRTQGLQKGMRVMAHEVFEASADPTKASFEGWDEAVDGCKQPPTPLPAFDVPSVKLHFEIPGSTDNMSGGACSTTGYTPLVELKDFGVTHDEFLHDYNVVYPLGWNLYILQSYVLKNGDVRHNAVWRQGFQKEKILIDASYPQIVAAQPAGWNLFILQPYALSSGQVVYNAVWRPGAVPQRRFLQQTLSEFVNEYDTIYPENWRPYVQQTYVTPKGELLYDSVFWPGDADYVDAREITLADLENLDGIHHPNGFRLYAFQPYEAPDGHVLYNVVWRRGAHEEKTLFGKTYAEFKARYDDLLSSGWRLYILNTYVKSDGEVLYDAVWREGTVDRPL